ARVKGVTWDNIHDPDLRSALVGLFEAKGILVFEDMEPTSKMQVALSKVFGPIKDHPTKSVPRAADDVEAGVIDLHHVPEVVSGSLHGVPIVDGVPQVA